VRKKFASLTLLFGMLVAVMLGSTSMAHAQTTNTDSSTTTCTQTGLVNVNVVYVCSVVDNVVVGDVVTVVVTTDDVLSNNDIHVLENFLNGFTVQQILTDPDLVDVDVLNNVLNGSTVNVLNVTVS